MVFGADDIAHPAVNYLHHTAGKVYLGGPVTGIQPPVHALAELMHEFGGLCFVDYAAAAPYVDIDMNPQPERAGEDPSIDAIFISPHKFVGGPGTGKTTTAARILALLLEQPGQGTRPGQSLADRQQALRNELNRQAQNLPGAGTPEGDAARENLGRLAASVSEDGSLRLWDLQSGEQTGLRRLEAVAYRVAWSPDGRLLATGDEAGQLCLWDTGAKEQLACLETGHGRVLALVFSPGSRWLATAGDDGRIRTWGPLSVARACMIGRPFLYGLGAGGELRQRQRIADRVGDVLDIVILVEVRQDHGVELIAQAVDLGDGVGRHLRAHRTLRRGARAVPRRR